jgi:hypothetical protein
MAGSVFETFIIAFASDTTDLKKGAAEAKKATDGVYASLSATNNMGLRVGGTIANLAQQYGGLLVSIFSLRALMSGINTAANFADKLDELSKALNVDIESLSAWGDAVKIAGGTSESFQGSIKFMTASLSDFATKGTSRAAPFFRSLGIAMTDAAGRARTVFEILPELADAFQGLSQAESFGIGQKIGLDEGTILLLQRGRREVDALVAKQKELGVVTKEDGEIAAAFNDAWDDTAHAFRSLFTSVGSTVLPAITWVIQGFEKMATFFRKNSHFITGLMIALGTAILVFVVPPLLTAAAAALVLYAPFLLIGAAVSAAVLAFALLYDEIRNFIDGNDSAIGRAVAKWPVLGKIIHTIIDVVKKLGTVFKAVFGFIWDGLGGIGSIINSTLGFIADGISGILDLIQTAYDWYQKISGFFGGTTELNQNIKTGQEAIAATNTPLGAVTSNSIANSNSQQSSSNNNVDVGGVVINTAATDAGAISRLLGNSMKREFRQAINTFDDSVRA